MLTGSFSRKLGITNEANVYLHFSNFPQPERPEEQTVLGHQLYATNTLQRALSWAAMPNKTTDEQRGFIK